MYRMVYKTGDKEHTISSNSWDEMTALYHVLKDKVEILETNILVAKVVFSRGGKIYTYNTDHAYERGSTLEVETAEGIKRVTCCGCEWTTKDALKNAGIYDKMRGKGILRAVPKQELDMENEIELLIKEVANANNEKAKLEKRIDSLESNTFKTEDGYSYF